MPDADREMTTKITADSAFGCAGQRCAAASVAITVGEAREWFPEMICDAAASRVTGYGLDEGVQMGPVISPAEPGADRGADRRWAWQKGPACRWTGGSARIPGYERGNFVRPTILADVPPEGSWPRRRSSARCWA